MRNCVRRCDILSFVGFESLPKLEFFTTLSVCNRPTKNQTAILLHSKHSKLHLTSINIIDDYQHREVTAPPAAQYSINGTSVAL